MAEEYVHDEVDDASSGTGELDIQSCDLGDCKELEQPFPLQASLCRKGVCVIMKDCPTKVNELKISKTGKHGSSKANMVGYDVITNRKYQETVPGHATMFGFEMKKMEYEVVDIVGGQITAMTAEGQEKFFNVPSQEHGAKLVADFKANAEKAGDQFYIITVLYAPRMVGKKWMANMYVESYKPGKTD
jgi:translation initiation factor 5A